MDKKALYERFEFRNIEQGEAEQAAEIERELVAVYLQREQAKGRSEIILTCLDAKVEMYEKFGFIDRGISDSVWGGEEWHEMSVVLEK